MASHYIIAEYLTVGEKAIFNQMDRSDLQTINHTSAIRLPVYSVLVCYYAQLRLPMRMIATRLNLFRANITATQVSAVHQQQQQRFTLLAQIKQQERAISVVTHKLRETRNTIIQINKQIYEIQMSIVRLEFLCEAHKRNLDTQLDARFAKTNLSVYI